MERAPAGYSEYADAVVQHQDWDTLRHYVRNPRQFQVREWAVELPAYDLDRLPHRLTPLNLDELPLSKEIKHELGSKAVYLKVFEEAVAEERALRWNLREPTTRDLVAYLRSEFSLAIEPYIRAFLERSPVGLAEFNVLRQELCRPRIEIPIPAAVRDAFLHARDQRRQLLQMQVAMFMTRLITRPLEKAKGGRPAEVVPESTAEAVFARLLKSVPVVLGLEKYTLDLRLEEEGLIIERLRAQHKGIHTVFSFELRKDDDLIKEWLSMQGRVSPSQDEWLDALDRGADRVVILAA